MFKKLLLEEKEERRREGSGRLDADVTPEPGSALGDPLMRGP